MRVCVIGFSHYAVESVKMRPRDNKRAMHVLGGQRYKSDPLITVSHAIRHLQLFDYIYPSIILMFVSPVIRYSKLTTNKKISPVGLAHLFTYCTIKCTVCR